LYHHRRYKGVTKKVSLKIFLKIKKIQIIKKRQKMPQPTARKILPTLIKPSKSRITHPQTEKGRRASETPRPVLFATAANARNEITHMLRPFRKRGGFAIFG
jgi:hypothetical protein